MCLFCYLNYTTPQTVCQAGNAYLTKPDKYVTILIKAYCTKTVGGSNLPPEMEVSNMGMMEVFYLLNLIINIIKLVLDICDRKRK